jgi:hypothetical protein
VSGGVDGVATIERRGEGQNSAFQDPRAARVAIGADEHIAGAGDATTPASRRVSERVLSLRRYYCRSSGAGVRLALARTRVRRRKRERAVRICWRRAPADSLREVR